MTINLSPATLPKAGSHYNLSIVAAVLVEPIEVTGDPASRRAGRQLDLADVVGQVEAK